jgi:hypothetical protein
VCAALPAERYDAAVPGAWRCEVLLRGARSAVVVASGGRSLWDAFSASPEFGAAPDPLDAYTHRVVGEATRTLARAGAASRALFAFEARAGVHADFVGLAAEAGLGAPSRLGLLVHPVYGPWLSLRAVVLTEAAWPPAPRQAPRGFDPCNGCPAPCMAVCPGSAVTGSGFDVAACGERRARDPACATSCAARRACVLGPEHAYAPDALAHHMRHARIP